MTKAEKIEQLREQPEPPWLEQLTSALGWQGGTIHQALEEVKKLKAISETLPKKPCLYCDGSGYYDSPEEPCPSCHPLQRAFVDGWNQAISNAEDGGPPLSKALESFSLKELL